MSPRVEDPLTIEPGDEGIEVIFKVDLKDDVPLDMDAFTARVAFVGSRRSENTWNYAMACFVVLRCADGKETMVVFSPDIKTTVEDAADRISASTNMGETEKLGSGYILIGQGGSTRVWRSRDLSADIGMGRRKAKSTPEQIDYVIKTLHPLLGGEDRFTLQSADFIEAFFDSIPSADQ